MNATNLRFYLVDVFAQKSLTGNPLAVVADAEALSDDTMQKIAREFNQSETTFVLPPTHREVAWRLRSFTPSGAEVFGAGHNALGAWWWLAESGRLGKLEETTTFMQEIGQHTLPVEVVVEKGHLSEIAMRQAPPTFGKTLTNVQYIEQLSEALGLKSMDLESERLVPQVVSTGAAHLLVPIQTRAAMNSIQANATTLARCLQEVNAQGCYVFCMEPIESESSAHARFFNPTVGIWEDPATGSAAGPLACYLVKHEVVPEGSLIVIEQGYTQGRPSRINVQVKGEQVRISGQAVTVAKGELFL